MPKSNELTGLAERNARRLLDEFACHDGLAWRVFVPDRPTTLHKIGQVQVFAEGREVGAFTGTWSDQLHYWDRFHEGWRAALYRVHTLAKEGRQ